MNRRKALGLTAAAAASGFGLNAALGAPPPASPQPRSPNVLLLMCDQLNARVLSCYGGPVPTPNLERLCRAGVRFDDAVCTYPICSPNRAAIVTGLYPHTHGIVYNVDIVDYPAIPAPPSEQGITTRDNTIGKLLFESGYDTHHYGKWHLHGDMLPWYPDPYGEHREYQREMKDVFKRVRSRPRSTWMDWYDWALPVAVNPTFQRAAEPLKEHAKEDYTSRIICEFITKAGRLKFPLDEVFDVRVADHAARHLEHLGPKPFFITASMNAPHDPNVVPAPYYDEVHPADIQLPRNLGEREARFENDWSRRIVSSVGDPGLRELLRIYDASVRLMDAQVGHILDALDRTGKAQDTIIVFTTDHGDMAGGHGMFLKSTEAFYDEVVRIPLIISYPRGIEPGTNSMAVSSADLMPTLLELTGQKIPKEVEGHSLAPNLYGRSNSPARRYSFCERITSNPAHIRQLLPGQQGSFMIRGEGWKYIRYADGGEYLYDLTKDPGEIQNLSGAAAYRNKKNHLESKLNEWLEETHCPAFIWRF